MKKLVVTDLDGTLLNDKRKISDTNLEIVNLLKKKDILFTIATGRSLFSVKTVLDPGLALHYLVSSSGAGIFNWPAMNLLQKTNLRSQEIKQATDLFKVIKIDFTIQHDVPDNHRYYYYTVNNIPDFQRRNKLYECYCTELGTHDDYPGSACQLIGFTNAKEGESIYQYVKEQLPGLKVIRSTSPLDHKSLWIEIYPEKVSKKSGIEYIAKLHQIGKDNIMVVGNDYNDMDMLDWSSHSFVVSNAPKELKNRFKVVSSNNKDGFSAAVEMFLKG